jgi:CheY-like chemotaxis protein
MDLGTVTVLVVDDDEAGRELIDLVFAQEPGIYYAIAAGGANAIAKLSDGPPDVILTDLLMPRVDGREVIAYARRRYPGIPIIAFSAEPSAQALERDRAVDGEPVHFLRKPFDLTVLVDLVRELAADRSWRENVVAAGVR